MTRPRYFTLRAGLTGSIAALALAPVLGSAPAFAQIAGTPFAAGATPQTGPTPTENVEVTGSRLRTSNVTSEAPITVVTAKQIEQSSSQTIEDVLKKLPSIGTDGNFATTNNGGNGSSCLDLLNLGINRTLVLVDGRRFVHSAYGTGNDCVDLDTIPIQMVDRIEVLKDGASTIYGADAVAGVINIITKKNFAGTQINLGGNITASGDDKQGDISGLTGFDFAQGRGNFEVSGHYLQRQPVLQKDRDWSDPVVSADNGPGNPYTIGSGFPVNGRYFGSATGTPAENAFASGGGGTVVNGQVVPFVNSYLGANGSTPNINGRYDYGHDTYLSNYESQANLAAETHFDVNDHFTAYASAFYTHKNTETQLSGQPVTGNPNTPTSLIIPQGNPFAEALGVDEALSGYRRSTDLGARQYNTGTDTYQATVGARGNITGNWNYDGYFTYGYSNTTIHETNQINATRLANSLGSDGNPADPFNASLCNAAEGCALFNPFGANAASAAAVNYVRYTASSNAYYQFRDYGGTITNNKLLQLPYGPLGLAVGFEYRQENGAYHPDPFVEAGQSTAAQEFPTGGGFDVGEVFGELNIPILKNLVMAKDLSADVSGRWSDYNTFGGVQNFKAGLNWSPSRDIRFRANLGTSVRQPAISEAFGGSTLSFEQGNDPCGQISSYGALAGTVAANCARKGVPVGFQQAGSGQIATLVGGNPQLTPESSRTYTIGTVLTPRFLKNFSAEIDYYHTSINNSIGEVPVQYVEDQCYTSVNLSSPFCASAGTRNASSQISLASAPEQNLGVTRTNGIDFDMSYLIKLRGHNTLSFTNELVDTIGYTEQLVNGGQFYNLKGTLNTVLGGGLYPVGVPVIRDNFTGTYAHGPFSFSWTVRYIDGMTYNEGGANFSPDAERFYKTNEVFYHDIVATYNFKKIGLVAGIDNLFDRTPPFALDASTNTAPTVYDVLGRFFYARMQVKF
ncbi:TonB-dependent receptor [Lichenicola cladoniae]|uniref:TonB-dependent receptor n=1 Tax=Lichenicola cladoniae TaxID=1484109 RepID=A0A6M8HT73_9PROT|nr:TonB-dependent receptor [Lichenicola cladoniae]NPD65380.1 TonB-dependent receptor [Acetobacteraceae bacterium]QKE91540.1 TonB-dependent receptor [Lichenicola cladoniae]